MGEIYCFELNIAVSVFLGRLSACLGFQQQQLELGAFIEEIGEVFSIEKKAEIWIKIETNDLQEEINKIFNYREKVEIACNRIKNKIPDFTHCEKFIQLSNLMLTELRSRFNGIFPAKRSKKGLANAVGSFQNFLFGTMDDNDRSKIENKLEKLEGENLESHKFNFKYAT